MELHAPLSFRLNELLVLQRKRWPEAVSMHAMDLCEETVQSWGAVNRINSITINHSRCAVDCHSEVQDGTWLGYHGLSQLLWIVIVEYCEEAWPGCHGMSQILFA